MPTCPNCNQLYNKGDKTCPHCHTIFSFSSEVLTPGTILHGRYEIRQLSWLGDITNTYFSNDKKLYDRPCIIRQFKRPLTSEVDRKNLEQSVLRLAKISLPNVAMVLDHFVEENQSFLVAEHISGRTLIKIYQENNGKVMEEEVLEWAVSMCDIVHSMHRQNITHGNINPSTVMVTDEGFIKFIDFGLMFEMGTIAVDKGAVPAEHGSTPIGQWLGNSNTMIDIYSIGATVYYLLTGILPLSSDYLSGRSPRQPDIRSYLLPLRQINTNVSLELESILQKALNPDVTSRYFSVTELSIDLKNLMKKGPLLTVGCEKLQFINIFPGRAAMKKFTIRNDGSDRLVGKLSTNQPWIKVSPETIDLETGEQRVSVSINTQGLAAGYSDSGSIGIITNGGRKNINVLLSVSHSALGSTIYWFGTRKWLVFMLIALVVLASSWLIVNNTILKKTPTTLSTTAVILFEDDFSNSQSGWFVGSDSLGEGNYIDGEYYLSVSKSNYDIVGRTNNRIGALSDFALEIDATLTSGHDDTWYGIGFRQQDEKNSYDFLIKGGQSTRKASYTILKQSNGVWSFLKGWTDSNHINKAKVTNHLKLICKGSTIEVYANGHKLANVNDSSLAQGAIVLEAARDDGEIAEIRFDNLRIYVP